MHVLESDLARLTRVKRVRKAECKRYANITLEEHWGRLNLWNHYEMLKRAECAGRMFSRKRGEAAPWTKEWFVMQVSDAEGLRFDRREFMRWFADTATHAVGSRYDQRITAAVQAEIARMIASGVTL
jgi:hypothetical protein